MGCDELQIDGEFRRLKETEIGQTELQKSNGVPVYDMSWVLKKLIEID